MLANVEQVMKKKYSEENSKIKEELNGLNYEDGGWNAGHL